MTEDVHQLLNALEIEKCHVLGMSMGGMIAQILAANYPERFINLGLLATSNNRPFLPPPKIDALRALTKPIPDDKNSKVIIDNNLNLLRIIGSPTIANSEFKLIAGLGHDIPYPLARYLADLFTEHFKE